MILKLLHADLKSEWQPILVAAAISIMLWITTIGVSVPGHTTSGTMKLGMFPFALLVASLGAKRGVQQRRRLLSQLPVTATDIRIAGWLSYFTIVAIACLIGVVILLISPPAPGWGWAGFAASAGRVIAAFTCWVVLLRIFVLGGSVRLPFGFVVRLAAVLLILILLFWATWVLTSRAPLHDDLAMYVTLFLPVTGGMALALILLDILLDRFADICAC